ncbi:MAG: 50S ribosomal protein L6 [Candidatus Pacearchaeota archaeon]
MKEKITEKIKFPEGIDFSIGKRSMTVKNSEKEVKKEFNFFKINVKKDGNTLILESENATKKEKNMIMTIKAHILNIIKGLSEGFTYKMEIAFSHFPITAQVDESNNKVIIKNFLGEKKPRTSKIIKGAKVEVNGNKITIESHNKEIAGQTAANLEKATFVKSKDRRKFQDGIYITEKPGREM